MTVAALTHCHHVVQYQRLCWVDAPNFPLATKRPRTPSTMSTISGGALAVAIRTVVRDIAQAHASGAFDHASILLYCRNIAIALKTTNKHFYRWIKTTILSLCATLA